MSNEYLSNFLFNKMSYKYHSYFHSLIAVSVTPIK